MKRRCPWRPTDIRLFRLFTLTIAIAMTMANGATAQEHPGDEPYRQVCQLCHGEMGRGDMAPSLVPLGYDAEYVLAIVREGYSQMPPISRRELSDDDVRQVVAYLDMLASPSPEAVESAAPASNATSQAVSDSPYDGPRTAARRPDLNGIWQVLNTAAWDIRAHNAQDGIPAGLSVIDGDDRQIPYQPWAAAQQQENYANRMTDDPVRQCFLPGVPRITYMPFPFQILQTPDHVVMTYEFAHTVRIVYTDGSPHPLPNDFWMGDSRGHWDGDTLVVDTTHFNGRTWLDAAGNFHSDALHVVERYTPTSEHHIDYEVTLEDDNVFTRPWTMRMPLYRRVDQGLQLLDYDCVDFILQSLTSQEGAAQ
jgi:cytochrome c5